MKDKYKSILITILISLLPIVGVIVGSFLTYKYSKNLYKTQRQIELREKSYSEIAGIKRQLIQSLQTIAEAKILTEYYDFHYKYLSGDPKIIEFAIEENKRMLGMIPEFSKLQRELFESLGNVRITYSIDKNLEKNIQELYDFPVYNVNILPNSSLIKTEKDLDVWKEERTNELNIFIKQNFRDKVDSLLPQLLEQIKINK
ncbi:MAG: hypothetical protein M0Q92_08805 [Methanoregula sp.]|jgi:hypothetical protein|nr:hypothetical protein [Methanoregula sp.]